MREDFEPRMTRIYTDKKWNRAKLPSVKSVVKESPFFGKQNHA